MAAEMDATSMNNAAGGCKGRLAQIGERDRKFCRFSRPPCSLTLTERTDFEEHLVR